MKQIFRIFAAVAVMAAVAGCYNDFDTPQPVKPSTDKDFEEMLKLDIMQVKELFLKEHKSLSDTGENTSWDDTKYTHIGWFSQAQYDKDMAALAMVRAYMTRICRDMCRVIGINLPML